MEAHGFCTIQSNISPPNCQQLSKNWGHSQAQMKLLIPSWENNSTLCISMSRELLSGQMQLLNPLQSCCDPKGTVLCPCVTTSGSTGHLTLSFLFPWSLPRFPAQCSLYHCSLTAGYCRYGSAAGQSPSHVQTMHLRKEKCCVETSGKESFGRQMGFFVYLRLEPDSN